MSKISLPTVASGYNLQVINNNFSDIASELQSKVLYRDNPTGEPNVMENDLDMNSNDILNVNNIDILGSLRANGVSFSAINSAFVWRGPWNSLVSYATSDAVSLDGASYIAVTPNINSTPPSADWNLLAAAGVSGGVDLGVTTGVLAITQGGTGETTATAARLALGAADASAFSAFGYSFGSLLDAAAARTALGLVIGTNVPSVSGSGATGTWNINITGSAGYAASAGNGGVTSVNGMTGAVSISTGGVTTLNGAAGGIINTTQDTVGCYEALLYASTNSSLSPGTLYAGSSLRRNFSANTNSFDQVGVLTGGACSGTWRCMSPTTNSGGGTYSIGLFVRVV